MSTPIIDTPLADYTSPALQSALRDPEFTRLVADFEWARREAEAERTANPRVPVLHHRALDRSRVLRDALVQKRLAHGAMIDPEVPEREFRLREGVECVGEAEAGSAEWLKMRQCALGGSDVGALCKVGNWGKSNYDAVRARKLDPDPEDQVHEGASLVGDLWEPELIRIAAKVLGVEVFTNKATYSDGDRHVNLDGFTLTEDGWIDLIVECKTGSDAEDWRDGPPAGYVLQTQHYIDVLGARAGLILVNINDTRLIAYMVTAEDKVPAGPDTNKGMGESFSYTDVKDYAVKMVQKWASERGKPAVVKPHRKFKVTDALLGQWADALSRGLVFVDLETSTLSAQTGHILEAAFVGEAGERLHRFYDVTDDHAVWNGTGAVEVHRITREDVAGQPVLLESPEAQAEIKAFIGNRVLVAHNSRFESSWLSEAGIDADYMDSMVLLGALVHDEARLDNSMSALCAWAGVPYEDAHRALPDALMLSEAFPALRRVIEDRLAVKTA